MRLILVRHGRTPSNTELLLDTAAPGADLDDHGRWQAKTLAERLAGVPVEAIYASNLVRTQQTAAPLAETVGVPITVLDGLREISAGDYEMASFAMTDEVSAYQSTLMKWSTGDLLAKVPGGENAIEFFERYDAAIAQIAVAQARHALAVSHGAALRVWAAARIRGFAEEIGHGHLDNTGVIIADGDPQLGWSLVDLQGTLHFE